MVANEPQTLGCRECCEIVVHATSCPLNSPPFPTRRSPVLDSERIAPEPPEPHEFERNHGTPNSRNECRVRLAANNYQTCGLPPNAEIHRCLVPVVPASASPDVVVEAAQKSDDTVDVLLSNVLGALHVINGEANLLVNFSADPNLNPKERGETIREYRLRAHRDTCKVLDQLTAPLGEPDALTEEELESLKELPRLRREFELSSLGDRPSSMSAAKLKRLINLEHCEAILLPRSPLTPEETNLIVGAIPLQSGILADAISQDAPEPWMIECADWIVRGQIAGVSAKLDASELIMLMTMPIARIISNFAVRADRVSSEREQLCKVLAACRSAIASLSEDAMGCDAQGGWPYRDELLSHIDKALPAPPNSEMEKS